jgi:hypothetical protein
MNDLNSHLLRVLALVPEDSRLEPVWECAARVGFVYRGVGSELRDATLLHDLEQLADEGYLERVFVERISLCPSCESHGLNVHDACVSCSSSNLQQFKALFHFRCGYVGPATSFTIERQGLRCPKCNRTLQDLGTDHDSPGEYFQCRSCAAMFQTPAIGARCLSCGGRFTGDALEDVRHQDVYAYRLTAAGKTAIGEDRVVEIGTIATSRRSAV